MLEPPGRGWSTRWLLRETWTRKRIGTKWPEPRAIVRSMTAGPGASSVGAGETGDAGRPQGQGGIDGKGGRLTSSVTWLENDSEEPPPFQRREATPSMRSFRNSSSLKGANPMRRILALGLFLGAAFG